MTVAVRPRANLGQALEDRLQFQHDDYAKRGVARFYKVATPVTIIRRGGEVVGAKPRGVATADFLGVLRGGRGIAVEAKEEGGDRFYWRRIQPQQRECLDDFDRMGGVAAVVLWWTGHDETWAMPWVECRQAMHWGASVPWVAGVAQRVRGPGWCPYLEALGVAM